MVLFVLVDHSLRGGGGFLGWVSMGMGSTKICNGVDHDIVIGYGIVCLYCDSGPPLNPLHLPINLTTEDTPTLVNHPFSHLSTATTQRRT